MEREKAEDGFAESSREVKELRVLTHLSQFHPKFCVC